MNSGVFAVIEERHFITLIEQSSNPRVFRIPVSDALLINLKGPTWRTGDVVKLSLDEQKRLVDLDARCTTIGDEAAIQQNKLQNKFGTLSWIIVIAAVIALIWFHDKLGWWIWPAIIGTVIAPIVIPLTIGVVISWFKK